MGICHGDFNQHNIVFRSEYAAVISFDNICYDVQIGDLARFMRKILEKKQLEHGTGYGNDTGIQRQKSNVSI